MVTHWKRTGTCYVNVYVIRTCWVYYQTHFFCGVIGQAEKVAYHTKMMNLLETHVGLVGTVYTYISLITPKLVLSVKLFYCVVNHPSGKSTDILIRRLKPLCKETCLVSSSCVDVPAL